MGTATTLQLMYVETIAALIRDHYEARTYWTMQKARIAHPVTKFTSFSQTTRIPAEARDFSL